jgi:hypothetical protein
VRHWEVILVPLIAMIVAVLASIFRGAEEAKRRNNQRRGAGSEPRRERPRTDSSGIDQFLEEIRRRQATRQESARTRQREPREEATAPVLVEERRPPRREPPREEAVVIVPVPTVPAAPAVEVPLARPAPIAPAIVTIPQKENPDVTAARAQLLAMLKSKAGLKTAFLIREVLDQPMCRRRR